jgi:hypothetical protein
MYAFILLFHVSESSSHYFPCSLFTTRIVVGIHFTRSAIWLRFIKLQFDDCFECARVFAEGADCVALVCIPKSTSIPHTFSLLSTLSIFSHYTCDILVSFLFYSIVVFVFHLMSMVFPFYRFYIRGAFFFEILVLIVMVCPCNFFRVEDKNNLILV